MLSHDNLTYTSRRLVEIFELKEREERLVSYFLYTHPAIQEVQVFGIPHEKYGEEVCAWIKLQDGEELDAEGVKAFCRDNITHFKVPSAIRFVDEFPMTVTGKIQKFKMREEMLAESSG